MQRHQIAILQITHAMPCQISPQLVKHLDAGQNLEMPG